MNQIRVSDVFAAAQEIIYQLKEHFSNIRIRFCLQENVGISSLLVSRIIEKRVYVFNSGHFIHEAVSENISTMTKLIFLAFV